MKPVTKAALIARINRKLAHSDQALHKTRNNPSDQHDLGEYHIIDRSFNRLEAAHVDLEEWGRELEVLLPHETVDLSDDA